MELARQRFPVGSRRILSQHDINRISRNQMDQKKDGRDNAEDNRDNQKKAAYDVRGQTSPFKGNRIAPGIISYSENRFN
jgi:hypothetical protein